MRFGTSFRVAARAVKRCLSTGAPAPSSTPPVVSIPANTSVRSLARLLCSPTATVEYSLRELGVNVHSEEDPVPDDAAELAALELGYHARRASGDNENASTAQRLFPRRAVASVLGHVNHGKTTLLDALRQTSVAQKEAGGITQHVGAFVARTTSAGSITFLDTPGHAAFDLMRSRSTSMTDLAVLAVAADDSVQEQTSEALAHVRRTNIPYIIAITKCDKEGASPSLVRQDLLAEGVELEDAGGHVQTVNVSATTRSGLQDLEDALLLQADTLDLHAPLDGRVHADIVDSRVDKGLGPVATVVVKRGTLRVGDAIVAGHQHGKVRGLRVEGNQDGKEAGPGEPADVIGLRGAPEAGQELSTCESEPRARRIAEAREQRKEEERHAKIAQQAAKRGVPGATSNKGSIPASSHAPGNECNRLVVVVKGDTQASAEAAKNAIEELSTEEVPVQVVHTGVGAVSGSDIELARHCKGVVVAFGVRAGQAAQKQARAREVPVQTSNVIYKLLETVSDSVLERAPTRTVEDEVGLAEVLQVFDIKIRRGERQRIAGCRIKQGSFERSSTYRVQRADGSQATDALLTCSSLKRHKLDVNQVGTGNECGLALDGFQDFREGDLIRCVHQRKERLPHEKTSTGGRRIVSSAIAETSNDSHTPQTLRRHAARSGS